MKKIRKVINKDIYNKNIIMDNFKRNIDKLVSRILNEEIENKAKTIAEQMEFGEWKEIDANEELKGKQKNIDVAEPKGKITRADFDKLRSMKNSKKEETKESEEIDEWFFFDDEEEESTPGDYEGDEDEEEEAEELSAQEPTYVGKGLSKLKMMGSFDDEHGWYDENDRRRHPDELEDYDEEEFPNFKSLMSKHGRNQKWFAPNDGERFFKSYQDKFGGKPFKVRMAKDLDEEGETEEGNAFTEKLANTPKGGKFKLGNKTYKDTSNLGEDECNECGSGRMYEQKSKKCPKCGMVNCKCKHKEETKESKKWIQKTDMKKGALHKKLGIPEGDKIPQAKLKSLKKELMKKAEGDKKLSNADSTLLKQVTLALTLKSVKESTNSLRLTEDELIDMIENIVIEQKVKDVAEKDNISKKEPSGLKKTEKSWKTTEKFGKEYMTDLVKKMKDYLKDSSKGSFEMNPEDFPQSNYDMEKEHNEMKYHPSDAVEEYIEAFAYPGMTNLVYDEIKPDDEMIDKQIKGDSKNGNAVTSKDGKALGNVSKRSQKTGERFKKNFDENLYGAEQMNVSYKRQPQPVDVGGTKKVDGTLKSIRKGSTDKAQKIMNQLESTEDKKSKIISEEMQKMKNLISYDRKTQ
jgi:hypothetical protein